jgi:hypothetical protein
MVFQILRLSTRSSCKKTIREKGMDIAGLGKQLNHITIG